MQANDKPTIVDILSRDPEPLPEWLDSDSIPTFDREKFFASRTVYYPGSGNDGQPVKFCALSRAAHTFVFVDRGVDRETIVKRLNDPKEGFLGYEIDRQQELTEDILRPGGWTPHFSEKDVANTDLPVRCLEESFGLFVVLKRTDGDEDRGPRRVAIIFIGGEGIASYDALYCQNDDTPPPYLVVVQDWIRDCSPDRFGQGGLLERIAQKCGVWPKLLLVGEPSKPWKGYEDTGGRPEPGGIGGFLRRLFWRVFT